LERARARLGATAVLVGHTRDDQAETVLLNVLRGAGLSGLAGMPARRGRVVRPLLGVPRADLAAVCRRLGLAPLDDPMNADPVHRRVWLRREVIPALEAGARRDLRVVLARQAAVARDDSELLDGLAAEVLGAAMVDGELQAKALATARVALARRAVRLWLGPPPPSSTDVDRVLSVARGEHRAVEVAGGVEVRRSGGRLRRLDVRCRQGTTTVQTIAVDLPGTACGHGLELTAWVERGIPVRWPDGRWTAVVDADPTGGWTFLRANDAGGAARLDSPDGSPLWVLGYRVADRVRVSPGTRRFLWLTVEAGGPRG
jgi:hypothetical protein